jgi:4a-hydroxytetrahydrobiopterin dehydratase
MKITAIQSQELLSQNWKIENGLLSKKIKFKDYQEVIKFSNEVFKIAETQNHHPEMVINYGQVLISINNHEENNISDKCYFFAKAVDFINIFPSI